MSLANQAVNECALAVVEVPHQRHIAYQGWIIHEVSKELQVVAGSWQVLLDMAELLHFHWLEFGRIIVLKCWLCTKPRNKKNRKEMADNYCLKLRSIATCDADFSQCSI